MHGSTGGFSGFHFQRIVLLLERPIGEHRPLVAMSCGNVVEKIALGIAA
jgi:hypothetical protein